MAKIIDIRTVDIDSIFPNEIFAIDTNVLLWSCYNNISHNALNEYVSEYQTEFYPNFIQNLVENGNKLCTTNLNISELCSLIERNEFEIYKYRTRKRFFKKKKYRKIERERRRYKRKLDLTLDELHKTYISRVEVVVIPANYDSIFSQAIPIMTCDTFDYAVIEYLKSIGVTNYISDDKDFCTIDGINLYTTYEDPNHENLHSGNRDHGNTTTPNIVTNTPNTNISNVSTDTENRESSTDNSSTCETMTLF